MQNAQLQFLNCFSDFQKSFLEYINCEYNSIDNGVENLMQSLKKIKDLFQELGLVSIVSVMDAIENNSNMRFQKTSSPHVCILSRLISNNCYCLTPSIHIHAIYVKFLNAYWLITHIASVEKCRRDMLLKKNHAKSKNNIPVQHIEIYHKCFNHVFDQLILMYDTLKHNIDFHRKKEYFQ